jgi:hypothetical protein
LSSVNLLNDVTTKSLFPAVDSRLTVNRILQYTPHIYPFIYLVIIYTHKVIYSWNCVKPQVSPRFGSTQPSPTPATGHDYEALLSVAILAVSVINIHPNIILPATPLRKIFPSGLFIVGNCGISRKYLKEVCESTTTEITKHDTLFVTTSQFAYLTSIHKPYLRSKDS